MYLYCLIRYEFTEPQFTQSLASFKNFLNKCTYLEMLFSKYLKYENIVPQSMIRCLSN